MPKTINKRIHKLADKVLVKLNRRPDTPDKSWGPAYHFLQSQYYEMGLAHPRLHPWLWYSTKLGYCLIVIHDHNYQTPPNPDYFFIIPIQYVLSTGFEIREGVIVVSYLPLADYSEDVLLMDSSDLFFYRLLPFDEG